MNLDVRPSKLDPHLFSLQDAWGNAEETVMPTLRRHMFRLSPLVYCRICLNRGRKQRKHSQRGRVSDHRRRRRLYELSTTSVPLAANGEKIQGIQLHLLYKKQKLQLYNTWYLYC